MEMCLTGRQMDAKEAETAGLVAQVFTVDQLLEETLKAATTIAEKSLPSTMMTKEAVSRVFETSLSEGVRFERRIFHAIFATHDQKEGMKAFVEKRKPDFKHQ
jgi:enoyl-CoA hydratase